MKRWTNGLPGATMRLGAKMAQRGLSVSQPRMRADTHVGPELNAPLQRPDTLMQLSRSSLSEIRLVKRGRAIHVGTFETCRRTHKKSANRGKPEVADFQSKTTRMTQLGPPELPHAYCRRATGTANAAWGNRALPRLPLTGPQQSARLLLAPATNLPGRSEGAVTEHRVQRRLAAILAADVVGYSALMERAEEATYAEFERLKCEVIEPGLSRHDGRLIKTTGDGALAEFASPSAAVRCAVEIQESIASGRSSLKLRIGVNLGEVIVGADGDLFGDGINIAVRLEGGADPGGILISEKVYSEVEGKLDAGFEDRGEQQLKNISKPVRAFALRAGAFSALSDRLSAAPPLPDKPSIAVLPFENMSGDPEQEYFADGMVEEIITALSRFKWLFVIARNSSFTYKGKMVDVKRVRARAGSAIRAGRQRTQGSEAFAHHRPAHRRLDRRASMGRPF